MCSQCALFVLRLLSFSNAHTPLCTLDRLQVFESCEFMSPSFKSFCHYDPSLGSSFFLEPLLPYRMSLDIFLGFFILHLGASWSFWAHFGHVLGIMFLPLVSNAVFLEIDMSLITWTCHFLWTCFGGICFSFR